MHITPQKTPRKPLISLLAAGLVCLVMLAGGTAADTDAAGPLAPGGVLQLINQSSRLDKGYAPPDLVTPDVATRKESLKDNIAMRPAAAQALEDMFAAAFREELYVLYAVSGYRSYGYQQMLFNQKAAAVGRSTASLTVAKAGESEHQSGLAIDIQSENTLTLSRDFGDTPEGQWVADNAHRFGFIIRYKAEWQDITGYSFEPWHLRYIGVSHATAVHMLDIPYETYHAALLRLPAYAVEGGNPYLLAGVIGDVIAGDDSALALLPSAPRSPDKALQAATSAYLPDGVDYQQAVWLGFPTPAPTLAPRIDADTDEVDLSIFGGG